MDRELASERARGLASRLEIAVDAYHQWIVRLTLGENVPSRPPVLRRTQMTSTLAPREAVELVHTRSVDGMRLLRDLTDEQLDLPTRPLAAKPRSWP